MTDRLQEIKTKRQDTPTYSDGRPHRFHWANLESDDVDWLISRVEELESEVERLRRGNAHAARAIGILASE